MLTFAIFSPYSRNTILQVKPFVDFSLEATTVLIFLLIIFMHIFIFGKCMYLHLSIHATIKTYSIVCMLSDFINYICHGLNIGVPQAPEIPLLKP